MSTPYFIERVVESLAAMPVQPDHAAAVHGAAITVLRNYGFDVDHEVYVEGSEGRRGRIDLVVSKWGCSAAIEIDARKPRAKSLEKLRAFNGGRIVALRGVEVAVEIEGIDAVVCIKVRTFRSKIEAETAKRAVRRAVGTSRRPA